MKCLAVVPARGGSRTIPRKNLILLAGKPLIAHAIERANLAQTIDRVVVSTDDGEIAAIARKYGAAVVQRPLEISGDSSPSEAALLHTLDFLREAENYEPDLLILLQCTSPLTLPEDIDGTVRALLDENADSALAVVPFHYFLWRRDGDGDSRGINHDKQIRPMRQQLEPQFLETGAVYVMRTAGFKQARHRFFGRTAMYVMPPQRCLEIDDAGDLRVAEILMHEQQKEKTLEALPRTVAALALDFDGVFTDNRVIVFQDGREAVVCSRSDGWGLTELKKLGLPILVLSTEKNPVVEARCRKLGIDCVQGIEDKWSALAHYLSQRSLDPSQVVFVGNDVNDLACLRAAGCGISVSDAHPLAQAASKIILSARGGEGAVREVTDMIGQKLRRQRDATSG